MRRLSRFFKQYFGSITCIVIGLVLVIVAIQVLTGTLGFVLFFAGAVLLIFGIIVSIY